MAYLELNVEQVNKSAELLSYHDHDIDSLSNVVDPRLDISSTSSKKFLGCGVRGHGGPGAVQPGGANHRGPLPGALTPQGSPGQG
ncbi:unnamed protein product, partial [Ixodes pacificus]